MAGGVCRSRGGKRTALTVVFVILLICVFAPACRARGESPAGVRINEVCSSNGTSYTNQDDETPDWVELYNPGDEALDLSGYFLSNDEEEPRLYSLAGRSIEARGFLLLAADKHELPFKLSAGGSFLSLLNPQNQLQAVQVPVLSQDMSYSLQPDGAWHVAQATPLAENAAGAPYKAAAQVASPVFSCPSGFYDAPFSLTIAAPVGCAVYYTLDGSVPDETSQLYTKALTIQDVSGNPNVLSARTDVVVGEYTPPEEPVRKGTIIRAVAVDALGNCSAPAAASYFVGFEGSAWKDVPYLSIVADPFDLFDKEEGIYVLGKTYEEWLNGDSYNPEKDPALIPTNYRLRGRESEIPASVQYFDETGALRLSQDLGVRINGNYSRETPEKSFKLYARSEYGGKKIDYAFWEGMEKPAKLTVRSHGAMKYFDVLSHTLLRSQGLLVSQYIPCVVFLNGEYWGLYTIRETQDEDDIADFSGVDKDNLVVMRNGELQNGQKQYFDYSSAALKIGKLDCTDDEQLKQAAQWIDIDNFITYLAGVVYVNNTDGLNGFGNTTRWRAALTDDGNPYADGRWRWVYQDLDNTLQSSDVPMKNLAQDRIFKSLWKNEGFQTRFLTRIMDMANLDMAYSRVQPVAQQIISRFRRYIAEDYSRYNSYTPAFFDNFTNIILGFLRNRPTTVADQLVSILGVTRKLYDVSVDMTAFANARLTVNGREAALTNQSWSGRYFAGSQVTLEAQALESARFVGWYENGNIVSTEARLSFQMGETRKLKAVYEKRAVLIEMQAVKDMDGGGRFGASSYAVPALTLNDADRSYTSQLMPAGELTMVKGENKAVTFTPEKKWKAGDGMLLQISTAGYRNVLACLSLAGGEGVPKDWEAAYSLDGETYQAFGGEISLTENAANRVVLTLPTDADDQNRVYLRITAQKKAKTEEALTLEGLQIYGDQQAVSLAAWKECVALCRQELGDDFSSEDLTTRLDLGQTQVRNEITRLQSEMMDTLINRQMTTVRQRGLSQPFLEGMESAQTLEITEQLHRLYQRVRVPFHSTAETVYLYAVGDQGLEAAGTYPVLEGVFEAPTEMGTYVLLDCPVERVRYEIGYRDEMSAAKTVEHFLGFNPVSMGCLWMDVELKTSYQENLRIPLPESFGDTMWVYRYTPSDLELVCQLNADADHSATVSGMTSQAYLVMDRSAEQGQAEYRELLEQFARGEAREDRNLEIAMMLGGGGIGLVLAVILALILLGHGKLRRF